MTSDLHLARQLGSILSWGTLLAMAAVGLALA